MLVKPKLGLVVIDPATTTRLSESGKDVPENQYWLRAVMAGDVTKSTSNDESENMTLQVALKYCLEKGDETDLDGDGVPSCNVLKKLTGKRVFKTERDAVLENMKGDQA